MALLRNPLFWTAPRASLHPPFIFSRTTTLIPSTGRHYWRERFIVNKKRLYLFLCLGYIVLATSGFVVICAIVRIAFLVSVSDTMERTQQIEGASNVLHGCTPIVVASVTYIGALAGISVWEDERRKIREERARETYQRVITMLMKQFAGEFDIHRLAETRALLAMWGDSKVIEAAAEWNRTIAKIKDDYRKSENDTVCGEHDTNEGNNFSLNDAQQRDVRAKLAVLVAAIRSSIFEESAIDKKEVDFSKTIEAVLFDRLPGDDRRP